MGAHGGFDLAGLIPRGNDDRDEGPGARGLGGAARIETSDRQDVDREKNEADGGQGGRRDEGSVDERYDSGTFWRASAR
jgi:hypothetical protein